MTTPFLSVQQITKHYDNVLALHDVSIEVDEGEIISLLGPSGSGKSTLLRCIAGLEVAERGRVMVEGRDITTLPPYERGFGMMFQQFALFPHRTVAQNIAFGLRMQRVPAHEQQARVGEMLELVGLSGYGQRTIFELSGGEQQRVALARSLAPRPRLLMLDEPLGSLDRALRERLVEDLRAILRQVGMTAIYVTHDQQEAFTISDRLVLMNRGEKVQEGAPETLYRHPANRFVAEFFGLRNLVPVTSATPQDKYWLVETPLGPFQLTGASAPTTLLLLRPDAARLVAGPGVNTLNGVVTERSFRGSSYRLLTRHGERTLEWEIAAAEQDVPQSGAEVHLALRANALTFVSPT